MSSRVSARDVAERLRPTTAVVSVVYANNDRHHQPDR